MKSPYNIKQLPIPKIIHAIWIGGGDITKVKSLEGIQSWLKTQKDYQIWIWYDDAHMYSINMRNAMKTQVHTPNTPSLRKQFESRDNVEFGRDISILRTMHNYSGSKNVEDKQKLVVNLINESLQNFEHLRELAKNEKRIQLCNIRSHKFLHNSYGVGGLMEWKNYALYNREMAKRGIFPAAASDILRYEILYNFGGIYMDVDLELTAPLTELHVPRDLALCSIISSANALIDEANQFIPPWRQETFHHRLQDTLKKLHTNRCFYLANGIVASHAKSAFIEALREIIQLEYTNQTITNYWNAVTNKSTIDMTGPNLVRDMLYINYAPPSSKISVPQYAVARLCSALEFRKRLGIADNDDRFGLGETFFRTAKVWSQNMIEHHRFWAWVIDNANFPMEKVTWETESALLSDTKQAGSQKGPVLSKT